MQSPNNRNLPAFPAAPPPLRPTGKTTLAAVVGTTAGAALLFMFVPQEESGRRVKATVQADDTIKVEHVSGKLYLKAYLDIVGVPTICDGITKGVKLGQTVTPETCAELLEEELIAHAEPTIKCAPALYGKTYQVIAVSLTFNIGPGRQGRKGGFCASSIARHINAGHWAAASNALLLYNKAGGRVNRGLDGRRHREKCLFDYRRPDNPDLPVTPACRAVLKRYGVL